MLTGITVEEYGEVMKREGFDDGKAAGEASKALEMAKMMKAENEPTEKIAKYTGLSKEKIETL